MNYNGGLINVLQHNGTVHTHLLNEYVKGVLPAEVPISWPKETLTAVVWVITSYACYHIRYPRYRGKAHVCTTTRTMVFDPEKRTVESDNLVNEVFGKVVTFNKIPALTTFHACCGGSTIGNEEIWKGEPRPWLRPVDCPCKELDLPRNGHRVGLCLWGAYVLGTKGRPADAIIKHYFKGVELENLGEIK